ncbi:MAG: hypothetical protein V7L23_15250 [Nostoc sp.]|uniref:hypothetical protein n=1 Tax=Nostoc sp. TaxID=1180 RepID=UPI002FEE75D1
MVKANWEKLNLPKQRTAEFSYSAPYAARVHEGFTLKSGGDAPARPWIALTVEQYEFLTELRSRVGELIKTMPLDKALTQAFDELAENFGAAMQQNIQDPIWAWPRKTKRQSGETVSSPRNIVDLGTLLKSYSLEIR